MFPLLFLLSYCEGYLIFFQPNCFGGILGIIDWLFGLLFGKKQKKTENGIEAQEVKFSDFGNWFSKHSEKEFKELSGLALPKFAEIKHLLKEIGFSLDELLEKNVEEGEKVNQRLRKIVGTSQRTFAGHMKQLLSKLQPPTATDFDSIKDYCFSAGPLMEREINSFGKSIAYTSIILKEEVSSIGANIQELQSALKQLHDSFSGRQGIALLGKIKSEEKRLSEKLSECFSSKESLEETALEKKKLEKKFSDLKQKLSALEQSAEFKAIAELDSIKKLALEKKEKLRSELVDLLAPLDKPLRRLESLSKSGAFLLEKNEKDFLRMFLREPLLAIKQDPRADSLKKILKELKGAIDSGKVSLKGEKDKQKRLDAINSLVSFDFFSNFFWKANQAEVELQKTEKELLHNSATQEKADSERELNYLEKELLEKAKAIEAMQKKQSAFETEIALLKQLLESLAERATGKKIEITLWETNEIEVEKWKKK